MTEEQKPDNPSHPVDFLLEAIRQWGISDDAIDHKAAARMRAICDEPVGTTSGVAEGR